MLNKLVAAAALLSASLSAAETKTITGEPNTTSRTIAYHDTDIVAIATQTGFTTLIELPKAETILEVAIGDKDNWGVNWTGNLAYVKPAKQGARTNLNLITASGNVYSFVASEITGNSGAHAELKLFVNPADETAITAMKDKPRFVPAEAVESYRQAAEQAEQELKTKTTEIEKKAAEEHAGMQTFFSISIHHDYKYTVPAKNPFGVTAIYHDDKFTYIEATPQEAPTIYEVRDGKPSLVEYELKAGRYVVPKILDDGYLRVGKAELKFRREG